MENHVRGCPHFPYFPRFFPMSAISWEVSSIFFHVFFPAISEVSLPGDPLSGPLQWSAALLRQARPAGGAVSRCGGLAAGGMRKIRVTLCDFPGFPWGLNVMR